MIERLIRWMIKKFLKGYHLHRDPAKTFSTPVFTNVELVEKPVYKYVPVEVSKHVKEDGNV